MSSRTIGYHSDRESDLFFDELDIFSAVFWKIFVVLNATNIRLPSRKLFQNWFCFFQLRCSREISGHFSINLVTNTNRDLIQIAKYIQYGKCHVGCSLNTAAILGCNTVKPSHTSWTPCGCSEFSAISTSLTQFIGFITEDLADKCTCPNCTGVCLYYSHNLLNLIWWNTCTDRAICCQCRG